MPTSLSTEMKAENAWAKLRYRLATNVTRHEPTDRFEGCLTWDGASENGYGVVRVPTPIRAQGWPTTTNAHRVACFLAHGPPPYPKAHARHLCHNRLCVEPEHLAWGTPKQNSEDSMRVGRWRTKLTQEQVVKIRADHAAGVSQRSLATTFEVTTAAVHNIVHGKSWAWLLTPEQKAALESGLLPRVSLTDRLLWLAPPRPDDVDPDDHVNRWVLSMAVGAGKTPSEIVDAVLSDASDTNYTAAVLNMASKLKVPTSAAARLPAG